MPALTNHMDKMFRSSLLCIIQIIVYKGLAEGTSANPTVEVERMIESMGNKLHFYCKFTPNPDAKMWYTVDWYNGISTLASKIKESDPIQYMSWDDFKNKTSLTEDNIPSIGIELMCSVKERHSKTDEPFLLHTSGPFFAGIKILNKTDVHLDGLNSPKIYIQSTIPFACPTGTENCALYVSAYIPSASNCSIPIADLQFSSQCGVSIPMREWERPHPLTISLGTGRQAPISPVAMELHLKTIDRFLSHRIFQNHILPDKVKLYASSLNMDFVHQETCYATWNHMHTFDMMKYMINTTGTFIMYRNGRYQIEVQLKKRQVFCGVAVRAGRDVFIVDKCTTPYIIRMDQYLDGILKWKLSEDRIEIKLPTGSNVNVTNSTKWFYWYHRFINVTIDPSLTDPHQAEGLCGNCDGNKLNDLTKRDGSLQHPYPASDWGNPTDFSQYWIVKDGEDLFKTSNHATLSKWHAENISLCGCEKPMGSASIENRVTCSPGRIIACEGN